MHQCCPTRPTAGASACCAASAAVQEQQPCVEQQLRPPRAPCALGPARAPPALTRLPPPGRMPSHCAMSSFFISLRASCSFWELRLEGTRGTAAVAEAAAKPQWPAYVQGRAALAWAKAHISSHMLCPGASDMAPVEWASRISRPAPESIYLPSRASTSSAGQGSRQELSGQDGRQAGIERADGRHLGGRAITGHIQAP